MERFKRLFGATDMTVGEPWKNIILFTIPMLLGNIAQQLYSTVDSIVVGHYVGDNALAAVGSAGPLFNMLLVLFVGISTGVGIMVSQYFGARDREQLSATIGTSITVTAIASLFLMLAAPPFIKDILELLNTPDTILQDCTDYLVIMMYGVAGMAYYNILSGILRGMGDSFSALIYLLIATVLNIVLDVYFVAELNMGVAGVSLATVIAQGISSVLCLWKLMHMRSVFDLGRKELKMDGAKIREIVRLGLPSGLTQAIFSSAMIVVQSLTNSMGYIIVTTTTAVMRIDGFAMLPNFTFGMAMTTFVGQNIGAGRMDRVREGVRVGLRAGLMISVVLVAGILIFGENLMRMFTSTDEVVRLGVHMMRILAIGYIAMAVTQSLSGVMRGAGDTLTPMWISLITTIIIRMPLAYGLAFLTRSEAMPGGNPDSLFISLLVSWVMGALITTLAYRRGKWRRSAAVNL